MMSREAMKPLGLALLDYYNGDTDAAITIYRNDGEVSNLPMSVFFRGSTDISMDKMALENCRGRVLDVGAGAGVHSLDLQDRGFEVCAMDVLPEACEVMRGRGIKEVRCASFSDFEAEQFNTLLILGRSICMVEDIAGLAGFLNDARRFVNPGGQIILNSTDVRITENPSHLAYHEKNRSAGRYIGEMKISLEYMGTKGPETGLLHVDPDTLAEHAAKAGWDCEILVQEEFGSYLAKLTKRNNI